MMYSQFEDMMLLALYQEHMSFGENDVLSFAKVTAKYGIEAREGWLIEAQKNLLRSGMITGPSNASNDYMAIGKISARGMRKVEDRWGTDDGVGTPLAPVSEDAEITIDNIAVPAADRIVRLDHNQSSVAEASVAEIIDALDSDNGNPDEPGLRERLSGQIKAARELIRAGEYRAYLMYELLVRALGELIKKYGNPTIVALANALLGAVVSQLLQAN
ncbi:hypothetical protein [Sphingomonas sp. LT1P40]|uniref:hypothetical protein n=1 Tax=Alteristakelama amylovorans TaxID=3096166 RepID=UPI002FCC459F